MSCLSYHEDRYGRLGVERDRKTIASSFGGSQTTHAHIFCSGKHAEFCVPENHRLMDYWNQLLNSDLCGHQAFIYSTSDTATDPSHLQEFIATQQQQPDAKISVLKLQDSEHVQHFRPHPYLYTPFVQNFVTVLLQQPTKAKAKMATEKTTRAQKKAF